MKRAWVVIAAVLFGACDGGVVGASATAGTYPLRTINGESLPYTISGSGANKTEIIDDKFILYEGNPYQ
jgi:hypothetical protein